MENVQSVKRVCIDVSKCVSESEYESEQECVSGQPPGKQEQIPVAVVQRKQKKKKKTTMTKEEKALAVAANIRGRMGFQQELLFRGKGKDSRQCFNTSVFVSGEREGSNNEQDPPAIRNIS